MENTTSTAPVKKAKRNIYKEVTQLIIDKMKEGHLVWNQGFQRVAAQNWVTKSTYSGINHLILNYVYGHEPCPFYATFKQIRKLGGNIKKGAKGKLIVYYSPFFIQEGKKSINEEQFNKLSHSEQGSWERKAAIRFFYVFNMMDSENCDGFDYTSYTSEKVSQLEKPNEQDLLFKFKAVLDGYTDKPDFIDHRNKNAYSPSQDIIKLVPVQRWDNKHNFVATALHEIIHSTGHESRLHRPNLMENLNFGSKDYAFEELTAEIGAAFLCQHLGILPKAIENTAAYLQSWILVLENDERLLFRASAHAQKAVNWVLKKD